MGGRVARGISRAKKGPKGVFLFSRKVAPDRVDRLLDANLNRAREGLRVLEDTARFCWEDRRMFSRLRAARHRLDRISRRAYPRLVAGRDSVADMGRRMKESPRRPFEGLVAANFRRVQEALRVLEEYGKVFSPQSAGEFKKIRFDLYIKEKIACIHFKATK